MFRRRWPLASRVLIVVAVLLGALSFVVTRGYADRVRAMHPAVGSPLTVLTAASDLERGTELSDDMLSISSVPSEFVPPGAIGPVTSIVGRVLESDVAAGEIITRARLAGSAVGPVAALVPDGLRAVIVGSGLPPGTLRAGDRVEVFATYGGGRPHTEMVATGLEVVRILGDAAAEPGIGGATTSDTGVTLVLLVDGDAAARLAYAKTFGEIQIAILGPDAVTRTP